MDVTELDAASHGGVDDARELRDKAFYAPAESRYRVFIIDEAHMVTTQGFNALLKIVEEPPEHLIFIFATTEPDKVLTTIRSRTHHYPFRLIPPGAMRALLERNVAAEGAQVEPAVYPLVDPRGRRLGAGHAVGARPAAGRRRARRASRIRAGAAAGRHRRRADRRHGRRPLGRGRRHGVRARSSAWPTPATTRAASPPTCSTGCETSSCFAPCPRRASADWLPAPERKTKLDEPRRPSDRPRLRCPATPTSSTVDSWRCAARRHPGSVLELLCARMLLPSVTDGEKALLARIERLERRATVSGGGGAARCRAARQRGAGARVPTAFATSGWGGSLRSARHVRKPRPLRLLPLAPRLHLFALTLHRFVQRLRPLVLTFPRPGSETAPAAEAAPARQEVTAPAPSEPAPSGTGR